MSNNSKYNKTDFIRLTIATAEHVSSDKETAKEYLSSEDLDVDFVVNEGMKRLKRLKMQIEADKTKSEMIHDVEVNSKQETYLVTRTRIYNDLDAAKSYANSEALRLIKLTGTYWIKISGEIVFDTRRWLERFKEKIRALIGIVFSNENARVALVATKVTLRDYSDKSYLLLSGSPKNPIKDYIPKSLISDMEQDGINFYFEVPLWFAKELKGLEYHLV